MIPTPTEILRIADGMDQRWRRGQQMFNALRQLAPQLARELTGTDADCFYNDNHIPAFWAALAKAKT